MITGAAFVPSTPLLVPEAGQRAAGELAAVRAASLDAVRAALAAPVERVVVVGAGPATRRRTTGTGSLRGFGVPVDILLDPAAPDPVALPLSITLGAWLLAQTGWHGDRGSLELDPEADDAQLDDAGRALAAESAATALLVVADGSASRTEKAPAYLHPDAATFDEQAAAALASGEPDLLAGIDRDRARDVSAAGRAAWRATAAALRGTRWDARLLADEAPYGVGYFAAVWTADPAVGR